MSQYDTSSTTSSRIESLEEFENDPKGIRNRWIAEIQQSEKEKEAFQKQGYKVIKRYLDERTDIDGVDRKFNIFYANVEIIKAALYAEIPTVEVSRRFSDPDDDVSRVAANILQRNLQQDIDEPHCDFDETMRGCIEDYLLPGLSTAWLRMEVETEERTIPATYGPDGTEYAPEMTYEAIVEQEVYIDYVFWDDLLWSPCRTWAERRWVGRKVRMTRDKLKKRFGDELGARIPLDYNPQYRAASLSNTPKHEVFLQATIYEIWDKEKKEVHWISKSHDEILDTRKDPLEIEDFEPCPRPLMANTTTSNCIPKADFAMMQDQYNELDMVNNRIQLLIQACKVVGVYDKNAGAIQRMLTEGVDNTLIPVDNWAMFAEKGGMKGVIDWLPLDQVVKALERLEKNREDIKQQIYELTGIADIVRGATKASETLGAQEIKAKFASIKIKRRQTSVAEFAANILRLKAAIICKHFSPEMIIKRSNIMQTEDAQFAEAAVQLLKDHASAEWLIKIKPGSMSAADFDGDKQEALELVGVISTMLEKAIPVFTSYPVLAPFLVSLLKFTVSKFRIGKDIESALDLMLKNAVAQASQPQPPKPDPEMIKVQAQIKDNAAKTQSTIQATAMKTQADIAMKGAKLRADIAQKQQEMEGAAKSSEVDQLLSLFKAVTDANIKKQAAENKEDNDGEE